MTCHYFLQALLAGKLVRKGKIDVAVIGMRVDARTRAAGELENSLPASICQCWRICATPRFYVQASAAGMTIFDLPASRAERDLEQWRTIIDWVEEDGE